MRPTGSRTPPGSRAGPGIALPLALQAIYLVCVPLASREGSGALTSFGFAYLVSSAVVAVTASSLGLVTSVPLARSGLDGATVPSRRRVVLARGRGDRRRRGGLRASRAADRAVAARGEVLGARSGRARSPRRRPLALWAVAAVGVSVTFPLVFVARRARRLPLIAVGAVVLQVAVASLGQVAGGLDGLALALAVTTAVVLRCCCSSSARRPDGARARLAALTVALAR